MKKIALVLSASFLLAACGKSDNSGITTGHYFQSTLNGAGWAPEQGNGTGDNPLTASFYGDSVLSIHARTGTESMSLYLKNLSGVVAGSYRLTDSSRLNNFGAYDDNIQTVDDYRTDSVYEKGTATITKLDKTTKLVEGTFSFMAMNAKTTKTVSVTNGVFSIYYEQF